MKNKTLHWVIVSLLWFPVCSFAQDPSAAEEDDGFSFSEDAFSLDAVAAEPEPVYDSYVTGGIGYIGDDSLRFGRFNGLQDSGLFINGSIHYLRRGQWDDEQLSHDIEVIGHDLGVDSRSLSASGGIQGDYRWLLDIQQTPFNDFTGKTPYSGVGSDQLSLPATWTTNDSSDFNTATQNLPQLDSALNSVDFKTERTRVGGGVNWNLDKHWSLGFKVHQEDKEGNKPLGIAWGLSGQDAAAVIVPEPIDYRTQHLETEVGYRGDRQQWSLSYRLEQFTNNTSRLQVDNPFSFNGWDPATSHPNGTAEMQLPPDNEAHTLSLAGAYNLSDTSRLSASLAHARYLQDEALLDYTSNPLLTVTAPVARSNLDAKLDTTNLNLQFYSRPSSAIDYKLRYRYNDRENKTPRNAYNYIVGDAESQIVGDTTSRFRFNTPYSFTESLVSGEMYYRTDKGIKLGLAHEYRDTERNYADREENTENTTTLSLRHRPTSKLSHSFEFSRGKRSGSTYEPSSTLGHAYSTAFQNSLGTDAFINHPDLRMSHLADRDRDSFSARLSIIPSEKSSIGLSMRFTQDDYGSSNLGLTDSKHRNLAINHAYVASEELIWTVFYSQDTRATDQSGWDISGLDSAVEVADPDNRWQVDTDDRVNSVGIGLEWQLSEKIGLNFDYSFTSAITEIIASDTQGTTVLPDLDTRIHTLRSDLDYDFSKRMTIGATFIYEDFRADDWQQDIQPDTLGRVLSLGGFEKDYDNFVAVLWTRYEF
jgi:MtrB/PioB family decaheme-associated outer membrane protein